VRKKCCRSYKMNALMKTWKKLNLTLSRCAALQIDRMQSSVKSLNITCSGARKSLSTDLSAHQEKAAYQTPKCIQLRRTNYGEKCLKNKRKCWKKVISHFFAEGGLWPLPREDLRPQWKKRKKFQCQKTALKSQSIEV